MNFSNLKKLIIPEGEVTKITSGGVVIWEKSPFLDFTDLVPAATDASGKILGGVGYAKGTRIATLVGQYATKTFTTNGPDYTTIGIIKGVSTRNADIYVYGLNFNSRVGDVFCTFSESDLYCRYNISQFTSGFSDSKTSITKLADQYYKLSLNFVSNIGAFAISGVTGSANAPIVTINQPILEL